MSFEVLLDRMMQLKGVEAVAFLDHEGEAIFTQSTGETDRLKILGAYQGILLSSITGLGFTKSATMITRYIERSVLTHRLKDGYFLCVLLSSDLYYAQAQFVFEEIYSLIEQEL